MNWARQLALGVLTVVFLLSVFAPAFAPAPYDLQDRHAISAPPCKQHPLGTDELGRDRLARVLYGTRISLVLAPVAALLATVLAAVIGGAAGHVGGRFEKAVMAGVDLVLSLPWIFLLITVRGFLPLNLSPQVSMVVTFALLGCLGWAASARVVCAGARALRQSDLVLQARAMGIGEIRLILLHVVPNLRPALAAQFWTSVPVFIIAEANLGALGLGVAEPLPSWGGMVRELSAYSAATGDPLRFVPLVLLIAVVGCFQAVLSREGVPA